MSLCVTTDVFCDGDYCGVWTYGVTHPTTHQPSRARKIAKEQGWTRENGRDLCPGCSTPKGGK